VNVPDIGTRIRSLRTAREYTVTINTPNSEGKFKAEMPNSHWYGYFRPEHEGWTWERVTEEVQA